MFCLLIGEEINCNGNKHETKWRGKWVKTHFLVRNLNKNIILIKCSFKSNNENIKIRDSFVITSCKFKYANNYSQICGGQIPLLQHFQKVNQGIRTLIKTS